MSKIKLNKSNIDKKCIEPGYYRDEELAGFCLKVTPAGKKVYLVNTKVHQTRKNVTVTIGAHGTFTADQARERAKEILQKLSKGIDPNDEKRQERTALEVEKKRQEDAKRIEEITLRFVLNDYLQKKRLKESTKYNYRCVLEATMEDWLDKPLVHINRDMSSDRHRSISDKSPGMADNAMRVLRALFTFAGYEYEQLSTHPNIVINPVRKLSQQKQWNKLQRRQTVIKKHQLKPWYEAVMAYKEENPTVSDYLILLLFTGLRKAEAESLSWENIDLPGRQLTVEDTKNKVPLHLPLTPPLYAMLLERWQNRQLNNVWVFPGKGRDGHITDVWRSIDKISERSGITFTLHDLRRTFITIADGLGLGSYTIKRLVNHKSSSDVTAGYFVADVEQLRGPMEKISNYIQEIVEEPKAKELKKKKTVSKVVSLPSKAN